MRELIQAKAFEELDNLKMKLCLTEKEREIFKPTGHRLTSRQYDILIRLAWKKGDIAKWLGVSENTVNVIINRLKKDFKVDTTIGLIVKALQHDIISLEEIKI